MYSAIDNALLAAAAFFRDKASCSYNWEAVREADPDVISTRTCGSSGFLGTWKNGWSSADLSAGGGLDGTIKDSGLSLSVVSIVARAHEKFSRAPRLRRMLIFHILIKSA